MKEDSYVVIQAFMVNDLHLKGNELIVYATVYGFTQDGEHWFHGTRGYLAEWCGCTKDTAGNCLKALVAKGYIERRERHEMGQTFVDYRTVTPMKKQATPYEKTSTPHPKNQPINNLEDKAKPKKEERETFDSIIDGFTDDAELREALREFLRYRRAKGKGFTNRALKLNLTKLSGLASDPKTMTAIVYQTIERGWSGFFAIRDGWQTTGGNIGIPEYLREYDL